MAIVNALLAAFGIGLLIFLHELGHFLAARMAGVRAEVFSLGFGPRLCGFQWRGTDFRLSAVPFGGYVMVAGQDPADRRYPAEESLHAKTAGQRALFHSGGVIMNALFALIVFPLVFGAGVSFTAPVVGGVEPGSAAWEAGLQRGERIVEIAGKPMYAFENMQVEIALHGTREVPLLLEAADGTRRVVTVVPHFNNRSGLSELGIEPALAPGPARLTVVPGGAAAAAGLETGDLLVSIDGRPPDEIDLTLTDPEAPVSIEFERHGERRRVDLVPQMVRDGVPPRIGVTPLPRRIVGIRAGSPLVEALGLRRDDRILAIDGTAFLTGDLRGAVTAAADGAQTVWLVLRDGKRVECRATATEAARQQLAEHLVLGADMNLQLLPSPGGAAALAGMRAGDWLVSIDDRPVRTWDELKAAVEKVGTGALRLGLLRPDPARTEQVQEPQGAPIALSVAPQVQAVPDRGLLVDLKPLLNPVKAGSFGEAVQFGTGASLDLVKQLYVTLKRLVTGEVGANNLSGIIRISQVSYQAAERGPTWFWYFLALLSVNLAFVNLLPIPVLDGGHLLFVLIEKVKGSPVSTRVLGYSQVVGLVFVLLLVLFVTYNDILRLL